MFRKSSTFLLVMILSLALTVPVLAAPLSAATTIPGGNVSGTWDASGSPYLIDGDITVPAGNTLTIDPGVEVLFQGWYSLTVNGTLNADGTENASILFGGGSDTAGWLGIRFVDAPDGSSLTYVTVENGRATGADPLNKGGGIYADNSSPVISYSTIRNNTARYSGGGIYLNNSNATLIGNTIINNHAGQYGGSANGGGVTILYSNPVVTDNIISGNSVGISGTYTTPSGYGGGLFVRSSDATFTGNLISDNHVNGSANSYARGGGLYLYYGSPNFVNNTISGNSVENDSGVYSIKEGGGIYTYNSNPTFVNTILWGNAPLQIFAADYGYTSTYTFAYSDVQDGQAGIETNNSVDINLEGGNTTQDPKFVDPASGDFTLQSNSPVIDAGTAYFEWNGDVLVDLSSADYNGSAPDMGAFEFGSGGSSNQPPVAVASVTPDHGSAPLTVQFSSADSYDPDGTLSATFWDFGDGSSSTEADPSHTYTAVGTYQAVLTVSDNDGATHSDSLSVNVQDGTTVNAGNVSGTWDAAGSPYRIEGDITVPAGGTLTIEAGTEISFQNWYGLTVNGTLLANGTANAPILFTTTDTSPGWLGIRFVNAPDGSVLDHVIVEKGHATGADPLNKGGGIYIDGSNPTISNSTIRDNFAIYSGGGLYLNNSNATLIGNTIINNRAGQGGTSNGGGLAIWYSNPVMTDNVISGNSVAIAGTYTTPSGFGGGLFLRSSDATFTGNLISDNHVNGSANSYARGGGLYLYYGSPNFVNNTISGNSVENSSGDYSIKEGGGIYTYNSNPTFVNTILWNNAPEELFAADYGYTSTYTIAYSDIQGGQAGIVTNNSVNVNWEAGNIDSDPLFNNDFTLQENSPAVDAGTAYFEWNGQVLVDLSSSEYNSSAPDMGAFESDYSGGGGSNQSPVAVATADPQSGDAPLTVQFSSDGSADPDGTLSAFAWDFGDGNTSNEANPSHTYADVGTYDAVLTVTDDQGATGSATVTIDVAQVSQNELHVESQSVSRERINRRFWQGLDTILITDQNNQPVAGVTVTANYSGPNNGQASGVTGADGTVSLYTDRQRRPQGDWCFEVTDVVKDGYSYNASANVVTMQCE